MPSAGTVFQTNHIAATDVPGSHRSIMFDQSQSLKLRGDNGYLTTDLLKFDEIGMALGRVTSSGHEIEVTESKNITLLLPYAGRLDVRIGARDVQVISGRPMAFRPTQRHTRASVDRSGTFRATTLQVPMQRLRSLALRCNLPVDQAFGLDCADLSGSVGRYLSRQLPHLADDLFQRPNRIVPQRVIAELGNLIDEQLCEWLGQTTDLFGKRCIFPAYHRVRQAEDFMEAHSDDPLPMLDLAQMLGVSMRSLQLAFQEVYGVGPRVILNRIRLDKARARLLTAREGPQVTTVAFESGFFHLSRFAQAYAKTFGELPSDTLARRRA